MEGRGKTEMNSKENTEAFRENSGHWSWGDVTRPTVLQTILRCQRDCRTSALPENILMHKRHLSMPRYAIDTCTIV